MCRITNKGSRSGVVAGSHVQLQSPHLPQTQAPLAKSSQFHDGLAVHPHVNQKIQIQTNKHIVEEKQTKQHHAPSSARVAPIQPSPVAKNHAHNRDASVIDTDNLSLRAVMSLCVRERPAVVTGPLLRECLLGQVNVGWYNPAGSGALAQKMNVNAHVEKSFPSAAVSSSGDSLVPVVIKCFNLRQVLNKHTKSGHRLHEDALAELQIHSYICSHGVPQVIGLYGMYMDMDSPAQKLYAYLEYASQGELFSVLHNRSNPLPLPVAGHLFVQLLEGVNALHSINVVHRDLSLENVLLTATNQMKICDFGLATICPPGQTINDGKVLGKVKYMCPELYYGEEYDPRLVDVWASGVILFIMMTAVFPYETPTAEDQRLVMLCNGGINQMLAHWNKPNLPEQVIEIFEHIFCPPDKRWTVKQILDLPICQSFKNVSSATVEAALKGTIATSAVLPSAIPLTASNPLIASATQSTSLESMCSSASAASMRSMVSPRQSAVPESAKRVAMETQETKMNKPTSYDATPTHSEFEFESASDFESSPAPSCHFSSRASSLFTDAMSAEHAETPAASSNFSDDSSVSSAMLLGDVELLTHADCHTDKLASAMQMEHMSSPSAGHEAGFGLFQPYA